MTNVQIQYWANQELKRHNMATESETYRHNVVSEQQNQQSITEVARHNQMTENIQVMGLAETKRHNLAFEDETRRHNLAYEGETKRHNLAFENETRRHNKATEAVQRTQATASMIQAEAARDNAKTNAERVESENQLRSAQLQYQNMTNKRQEFETDVALHPINKFTYIMGSPIGSALSGAQGSSNAAGGLFSAVLKTFA